MKSERVADLSVERLLIKAIKEGELERVMSLMADHNIDVNGVLAFSPDDAP